MPLSALARSIATKTKDYRKGEWGGMTPQHVVQWAAQFDKPVQLGLLTELDHLLGQVYVSKADMTKFLTDLVKNPKITGGNPDSFWRGVGVLDIQQGGNSQKEMNVEFDNILTGTLGYGVDECEPTSGKFIYIDDAVFSGLRLKSDLLSWLPGAPDSCEVHVVLLGLHRGGCWYAEKELTAAAAKAKKKVKVTFWRCVEFEDRKSEIRNADVLRPSTLGTDPLVLAYASGLAAEGYPVQLRQSGSVGLHKMFSSSDARELFEQEMLKKGAYIRSVCTNLPPALRPLGFTGLRTLGSGGTLVTYRNCPNNCPLPYWVGDPWHALFPRRTNAQSALGRSSLWT
ncbi:hypothetical protein L6R50_19790 [Myxococcota bacterium]|nr:hypothetical protein [Myxococcota bacterium]